MNYHKSKIMKNHFIKVLVFIFCVNMYSQKTTCEKISIENQEIDYLFISSKSNSNTFQIIIVDNEFEKDNLKKIVKRCSKKRENIGSIYFVAIPKEFKNVEEKFILEFICSILSKKKLIDKEMNLITNKNYSSFYEETRIKNNGKYKNSFLNKVNKLSIIDSVENICDFIE